MQYDVEEWIAATTRGRHLFNYNFRMDGKEMADWDLVKVVSMRNEAESSETVYMWQPKAEKADELVSVTIAEFNDWRTAQKGLQQALSNCMRSDIPRGTGKLTLLGDVNFVGRDPSSDIAVALYFTRGNICAFIRSVGKRHVSVADVATGLDQLLSDSPQQTGLLKRRMQTRDSKMVTVRAEEPHILIENMKHAIPRNQWLKVLVPDGEVSRKGDALIYVSSKSGKKQIGIFRYEGPPSQN